MIELIVGSRFYYEDKLCEVVEDGWCLNGCVFKNSNKCNKVKCGRYERQDKKDVYYKEVKNDKD